VHGGVKFYRGSPAAARSYVEAGRSRVDDYYLAEGTGLADLYVATTPPAGSPLSADEGVRTTRAGGTLDGPAYERWVAGYDPETGLAKGRLRHDKQALRFVEVVVNGPKTWSLVAALHPEVATVYDAAQDRAAREIVEWLAVHATTRVGPRGRQVQVPVERLEAVVVRHQTSRAGDPHRHLHLQVNARVFAAGGWRGLHSVGVVHSIEALNGIGHAAVMCDPEFRTVLAGHGYTLDPESGEVVELAPYAGSFSARAAQISGNFDRLEAAWRAEHPDAEPGPVLRQAWDRAAWARARPEKVLPAQGGDLRRRWVEELTNLGFRTPSHGRRRPSPSPGQLDRRAVVDQTVSRLGARRSSWNGADVRGEVERLVAAAGVVAAGGVRRALVEDLAGGVLARCVPLPGREDVPDHVRSLTSQPVLEVEDDLLQRLTARAAGPDMAAARNPSTHPSDLDPAQRQVVAALAGKAELVVVEGAAGAGKTATLAAAQRALERQHRRILVVTPNLKAAHVAQEQVGARASTAARLVHQHGFRWHDDGSWTREPVPHGALSDEARLSREDLLLVDEAGMLDQDTARALLAVADEAGARVAFVGDRHQLPAVGRGGVLDHAVRIAGPSNCLELDRVHRFTDAEYADLTLMMRLGVRPEEVFDRLQQRGLVQIHRSDVARLDALTKVPGTLVADTREQVAALNSAVRERRLARGEVHPAREVVTAAGERIGVGDQVATRRNDPDLGVANRDRWTVTGIDGCGGLLVRGDTRSATLAADYVREHTELAYATTVHGVQGETVDHAHLVVGDSTGAASAYVGMTRGRVLNTAHLVAESPAEARAQWVAAFSRDRADLGPRAAAAAASRDLERYGPQPPVPHPQPNDHRTRRAAYLEPQPTPSSSATARGVGIGR